MPFNALVICDQAEVTSSIGILLAEEGLSVYTANNGRSGVDLASRIPIHLAITGMVQPGLQGPEIIRALKAIDAQTTIWAITEAGNLTADRVVEAMKLGADDFLTLEAHSLPVQRILQLLTDLKDRLALLQENSRLQEHIPHGFPHDSLLGHCEQIRHIQLLIHKVAPTEVPVLITGESGTGKEIAARNIWELSERKERPYVPINCGAIPETLLESELYGHEKGSFTGAHTTKVGKLETANRGTVFLDEIGEMPMNLQVKLLRFLQEGEIQRVGGTQTIRLDVRILSATNRSIGELISSGTFREDLFYRLNVIHLHLPPLRERGTDILLLANFFLRSIASKEKRAVAGFSPLALTRMQEYSWPGNIRELKHRIHRAVILASGNLITTEDMGFPERQGRLPLQEAKDQFELRYITDAMVTCRGNVSKAARLLGIARQQLQRYLHKHGLNPVVFRSSAV